MTRQQIADEALVADRTRRAALARGDTETARIFDIVTGMIAARSVDVTKRAGRP